MKTLHLDITCAFAASQPYRPGTVGLYGPASLGGSLNISPEASTSART